MSNPPKRGGLHPTYGDYVGGSLLDDDYGQKNLDLVLSSIRLSYEI